MVPYNQKKAGTAGMDPLEVTRTTSNNSMTSVPDTDSPTSSRMSSSSTVLECDYDLNPTVLYQAIEAKQWDYAISLFTEEGKNKTADEEKEASATWVVRKESNGKLRWRLLPLHAAIIFGSPQRLVELLLADYPLAAQCKDDRGMLPLHLAFRCQASWDVIDELLTTYPLGVFVSERKGRMPIQCVSKSMPDRNNHDTIQEVKNGESASNKSSFKTVAQVLDLYSQIVISGERKKVEQETRTLAQTSISQLQDFHQRQLETMRKKTESDKAEAKHQREQLETENKQLKERLEQLEKELVARDYDMSQKLTQEHATGHSSPQAKQHNNKSVDRVLRMMAETMVRQQKTYHGRVQKLMTSYQELVSEREQLRSIFLKESNSSQQKEDALLESFRKWHIEEDKKLKIQERSLMVPPSPSASVDSRTGFPKDKKVPSSERQKPSPESVPKISSTPSSTTTSKTTITQIPLSEGTKSQKPTKTVTDLRDSPAHSPN